MHTAYSLIQCWPVYNSQLTKSFAEFDRLRELCVSKPLRGTMVNLQRVPQSKTIQVYNIGTNTEEILTLYFENKSGKDGRVIGADVPRQDDFALIEFEKCASKLHC